MKSAAFSSRYQTVMRHDDDPFDFELVTEKRSRKRRSVADESGVEVGPDQVLFFGTKIVVCAVREMPQWEAVNFRRPKIIFQGNEYYLSRKFPGDEDHPFRYELAPWPNYQEDPPATIEYDEDYVAQRDGRFNRVRSVTGRSSRFVVLYPFLGFFWSGVKKSVLEPKGFNPLRISLASCLLAYAVFVGELLSFFFGATGFWQKLLNTNVLWFDYLCLILFPVDAAIRFFQIVNGSTRYPDGFLEWAFKYLLRWLRGLLEVFWRKGEER